MPEMTHIYRWNRHGRRGEPCRVTARCRMNSIRVEFADGYVMITSGNAVKQIKAEERPPGSP
jgi:hypothetical protein